MKSLSWASAMHLLTQLYPIITSQKGEFLLNGDWLPLPKTHVLGGTEELTIMGHAQLHFASEQEKQVMQLSKNKAVRA